MQKKFIARNLQAYAEKRLEHNPVVALLGARQVGKSTLAKQILKKHRHALYLDLEKSSDRQKIEADPELFLKLNQDKLICLDEIQFLPNIFQSIKGHIDQNEKNGQFLLLGSASVDLVRQSSETLAGRIAYIEIPPFVLTEIADLMSLTDHWLKGGYPRSLLQKDLEESMDWRRDYIKTFLERDIPRLGISVSPLTLEKFWRMLAHHHCQLANLSMLAKALGVSHHTVKSYMDILEQTFVIRTLRPYQSNEKKRLIKSPKVYIRDTGLLHTLLNLEQINDLLGHPVKGNSFESYVIENIIARYPRCNFFFYRDGSGNEIDLILQKGSKTVAVEIKCSSTPKLEKGFWNACEFLKPQKSFVIAMVDSTFPGSKGVEITNLQHFLALGDKLFG